MAANSLGPIGSGASKWAGTTLSKSQLCEARGVKSGEEWGIVCEEQGVKRVWLESWEVRGVRKDWRSLTSPPRAAAHLATVSTHA